MCVWFYPSIVVMDGCAGRCTRSICIRIHKYRYAGAHVLLHLVLGVAIAVVVDDVVLESGGKTTIYQMLWL